MQPMPSVIESAGGRVGTDSPHPHEAALVWCQDNIDGLTVRQHNQIQARIEELTKREEVFFCTRSGWRGAWRESAKGICPPCAAGTLYEDCSLRPVDHGAPTAKQTSRRVVRVEPEKCEDK